MVLNSGYFLRGDFTEMYSDVFLDHLLELDRDLCDEEVEILRILSVAQSNRAILGP